MTYIKLTNTYLERYFKLKRGTILAFSVGLDNILIQLNNNTTKQVDFSCLSNLKPIQLIKDTLINDINTIKYTVVNNPLNFIDLSESLLVNKFIEDNNIDINDNYYSGIWTEEINVLFNIDLVTKLSRFKLAFNLSDEFFTNKINELRIKLNEAETIRIPQEKIYNQKRDEWEAHFKNNEFSVRKYDKWLETEKHKLEWSEYFSDLNGYSESAYRQWKWEQEVEERNKEREKRRKEYQEWQQKWDKEEREREQSKYDKYRNPYYDDFVTQFNNATDKKQLFKQLARKYHPDVGGDQEVFKSLNNAYDRFR